MREGSPCDNVMELVGERYVIKRAYRSILINSMSNDVAVSFTNLSYPNLMEIFQRGLEGTVALSMYLMANGLGTEPLKNMKLKVVKFVMLAYY